MKIITTMIIFFCASVLLAQEDIAILVGISDYKYVKEKGLSRTTAAEDIDQLEVAYKNLGYTVFILKDSLVTRAEFERLLEELQPRLQKANKVVVNIGGHGVRMQGADYYLLWDTNMIDMNTVLIVDDEIYDRLSKLGMRCLLVITDICRDIKPLPLLSTRSLDSEVDDRVVGRTVSPVDVSTPEIYIDTSTKYRYLIKSASVGEVAHEKLGNHPFGIFSFHLLNILSDDVYRIKADLNFDNKLTINELFLYLKRQTFDHVLGLPNKVTNQEPQLISNSNTDFIFMKLVIDTTEMNPKGNTEDILSIGLVEPTKFSILLSMLTSKIKSILGWDKSNNTQFIEEENGVFTVFDLYSFLMSKKPYALLFVNNSNVGWSQKMGSEIYHSAAIFPYISPTGNFQMIYADAYIADRDIDRELLDVECLTQKSRIEIRQFLTSPKSPRILLLKRTEEDLVELIDYFNYTKPKELSKILESYSDIL